MTEDVAMTGLMQLSNGVTLIVVRPGGKLTFVSSLDANDVDLESMLGELKKLFPRNEVTIISGIESVIYEPKPQ